MEALNRFAPKRLSMKARDFVLYCHQHRNEAAHTENQVAYHLKHYPQAATLKPATARDWFNTYTVIEGSFVIKHDDYSALLDALKEKGYWLAYDDDGEDRIYKYDEAQRINEERMERNTRGTRVIGVENVLVDPTLKKEFVKQKELK